MKCLRALSVVLGALFCIAVVPARADDITYSFSDFGVTGTFTLPSTPTPSIVGSNFFQINDVTVALSGGLGTFTDNLDFFAAGGIGSGPNQFSGPVLFSGTLNAPTLLTGDFFLTGFVTPDSDGPVPASGILHAVAATPEPSSLLLLSTGLLGAGALVYRRRGLQAAPSL